jgi:fructose/tagatose bisphosphate aldolase
MSMICGADDIGDVVRAAWEAGIVIPAFNVPYLPMLAPIVRAVKEQDSYALIETARIEWQLFECYGPAAVGNLHGAVSKAFKDRQKTEARLDLDHLARLREATQVPLVLHGGSAVRREDVLAAIGVGIAKINIATEVRQAFEQGLKATGTLAGAKEAVYERTTWLIRDYYGISGSRSLILGRC